MSNNRGHPHQTKNQVFFKTPPTKKSGFLLVSHDSIIGCVRPSVRRSVGPSVRNGFVSAGRDERANDLFRVYELVPQCGRGH